MKHGGFQNGSCSSTANNRVHDAITALYQDLGEDYTNEQYSELQAHYQKTIIQALQDLRIQGKLKTNRVKKLLSLFNMQTHPMKILRTSVSHKLILSF